MNVLSASQVTFLQCLHYTEKKTALPVNFELLFFMPVTMSDLDLTVRGPFMSLHLVREGLRQPGHDDAKTPSLHPMPQNVDIGMF